MDDVETRFNRLPRNVGFSYESAYIVDVFGHGVNVIVACDLSYSEELDKLAWYILHNCDQAQKYIKYILKSLFCILHLFFFMIFRLRTYCIFFELQNV